MSLKNTIIAVLLFLFTLSVVLSLHFYLRPEPTFRGKLHSVQHYDEGLFTAGISRADNTRTDGFNNNKILGGIVPHHLIASHIIADFFRRLSYQHPETLILIGPNHEEKGTHNAITSEYGWQTPSGIIIPNEDVINHLLEKEIVVPDEEVLPRDQALAGLMPYIDYYLPDVKVVPILVKSTFTENEITLFANELKSILNDKTVLVASIDFSHYLTSEIAEKKDAETLQAIQTHNYKKILSFNSDYLDSPVALVTQLMAMKEKDASHMDVLFHTDSGTMQNNRYVATTSYYSIIFTKPSP